MPSTIVFFMGILFFVLRFNHSSDVGDIDNRFLLLAKNLSEGHGYTLYPGSSDMATYPAWGYPLIIFLFQGVLGIPVLLFHFTIFVICYLLFYEVFAFYPEGWKKLLFIHTPFLFFSMLMTVTWSSSFTAIFLLLGVYCHRKKHYIFTVIFLSLIFYFRSEGILFAGLYLIYLLAKEKKIIPIFFFVVIVSPWTIVQSLNHKAFVPVSTNGGGVMYLTLGQLPNNPWKRTGSDKDAYDFVAVRDIKDAWSIEGNQALSRQFFKDISNYPEYFIAKLIYNGVSIFNPLKGGLYVFEPERVFYSRDEWHNIKQVYGRNLFGMKKLIQDILRGNKEAYMVGIKFVLNRFSGIYFLFLTVILLFFNQRKISLIHSFIYLQFFLCSLFQFEPRHISNVIILFPFLFIDVFKSKIKYFDSNESFS